MVPHENIHIRTCFTQLRPRRAAIPWLLPLEDEAGLEEPPQIPTFLRIHLGDCAGSLWIASGLQVSNAGCIRQLSILEGCAEMWLDDAGFIERFIYRAFVLHGNYNIIFIWLMEVILRKFIEVRHLECRISF
jgi:hypothetical protein